jgi:dienelactone hydrolase
MFSVKALEIVGYRNERVPNTFFEHKEGAHHLAILLPGLGYTCQMPLLYYPNKLLREMGADVLQVEYAYNRRADYQAASDEEQEQWLFADVTAACHVALAQRAYRDITLIGKSLGTLAMMRLLAMEWDLIEANVIWLTPLLKRERLRHILRHHTGRGLTVIGGADPHYDEQWVNDIRALPTHKVCVVDGANHSLEMGDMPQTIQALERIMQTIQKFLTR